MSNETQMPEPMTARQIELARHALGLPNDKMRSYRNRYVVGISNDSYEDWLKMSVAGYAKIFPNLFDKYDYFKLTLTGAKAALLDGEMLDPNDFPNG